MEKSFQINSELVQNQLANQDNIKVVTNKIELKNLCIIYFSSNEIYYPNTSTAFTKSIVEKDRYEWQNNLFDGASQHIFVRDIQKQWYIEGVSTIINTPELLVEELKKRTENQTIYTIGSSAGGYAAILYGSLLGAKRVYAFNAQLNLNIICKNSNKVTNPLLFKYLEVPKRVTYFDVSDFLKKDIKYYYFHSCKSLMDVEQYNSCKERDLLTKISFYNANHGFPFFRHDLRYVLSLSEESLNLMASSITYPLLFSIKIHGVFKSISLIILGMKNRVKKKFYERINK